MVPPKFYDKMTLRKIVYFMAITYNLNQLIAHVIRCTDLMILSFKVHSYYLKKTKAFHP